MNFFKKSEESLIQNIFLSLILLSSLSTKNFFDSHTHGLFHLFFLGIYFYLFFNVRIIHKFLKLIIMET